MGFLIKTDVINALQEDMETSMMCYEDKPSRDIVRFCYKSMAREIDGLPQYRVDSVIQKID